MNHMKYIYIYIYIYIQISKPMYSVDDLIYFLLIRKL